MFPFVALGQLNILAGATKSKGSQRKVKPSTDQRERDIANNGKRSWVTDLIFHLLCLKTALEVSTSKRDVLSRSMPWCPVGLRSTPGSRGLRITGILARAGITEVMGSGSADTPQGSCCFWVVSNGGNRGDWGSPPRLGQRTSWDSSSLRKDSWVLGSERCSAHTERSALLGQAL